MSVAEAGKLLMNDIRQVTDMSYCQQLHQVTVSFYTICHKTVDVSPVPRKCRVPNTGWGQDNLYRWKPSQGLLSEVVRYVYMVHRQQLVNV